jgi:hypothetical protein
MKNAVIWDTETSSYLTGNTLSPRYRVQPVVRFEVLTAATTKNAVSWEIRTQ